MIKNILKNKIIIIALLVLIFFGMLSNNIVVNAAGGTTIDPDGGGSRGAVEYALGDEIEITFGAWSTNNNVFCVHHGQTLISVSGGSEDYKITARYEISASEIKIETYGDSEIKTITDEDTINYGQGLAYILSLDNEWGANPGESDGTNEGLAQHVLWAYIDGNELCEEFGMVDGKSITLNSDETEKYNTAKDIANGIRDKEYKAVYYIFENEDSTKDTQRLIILESTAEEEKNDDIYIKIEKVDALDSENKLAGAKFDIVVKQWGIVSYDEKYNTNETTDADGIIEIGPIVSSDIDTDKKIKVVIKETDAPDGYKKLKKDIEIDLEYKSGEWVLVGDIPTVDGSVTGTVNNSKISLVVSNELMNSISLNLIKESFIGAVTDGTTFSFDFTNVSDFKVAGKHISSLELIDQDKLYTVKKVIEGGEEFWAAEELESLRINALIVKDGGIFIDEINFEDSDTPIKITINEIDPPVDHSKISKPIEIEVELNNALILPDKAEIISHTDLDDEIRAIEVVENAEGENFQVNVELMNYVYIDITGTVWLDGQTGLKSSSNYDGSMNDTFVFEGIKVQLGLEGSILTDVAAETTKTDGTYYFSSVKYIPGMYVIFEYDGINYITTIEGIDSNATEDLREEFNEKFALITSDGAYSTSGNKSIELKYDEVSSETKATVNTTYAETKDKNTIKVSRDFSEYDSSEHGMFDMNAIGKIEIDSFETKEIVINCGLVRREYDLDLSTNLEAVKTTVNGKTANYEYSIDDDESILYVRGEGNEDRPYKVEYNQKIYESDYNYNLGNYFNNTGEFLVDGTSCIDNELQNDASDITATGMPEGLEIYVKYKLQINNQTNKKAYVFGISDYYSTDLEFNSLEYDSSKLAATYTDSKTKYTIDGKDYYSMNLKINSIGENYIKDSEEIYLIFKVKKYNPDGSYTEGWKNIGKEDSGEDSGLNINHIAEITSYGSEEGFIDMNSKPGNAIQGSKVRFEDDTDEAGNLKIKVDKEEERALSGIIWDDSSEEEPDGEYKDGETLIDGVTVQLIELRKVSGITLEYIWQETETGSGTVKRVNISGTGIETVDNSLKDKGEDEKKGRYEFTGYIPGNYIIRYKYGTEEMLKNDDIGGTDNNKYDGNAYKSTYDSIGEKYKAKALNIKADGHNGSDAFDNEARRLEEMSIFAGLTVDSTTSSNLKDHWMCADTNKIDVCFEDPKYTIESAEQTVEAVNDDATQKDIGKCTIENVDLGLMKRPETEISLEKHLTALAIDVAGEGKILDATFDLKGFNDAGSGAKMEDHIKGLKENLSTIYSERDERGFWKFETDVNELMNGAELTAEYTYVVYNNSEGDYLSAQLMNAYEQLNNGEPCQFIYEGETSEITLVPGVVTFNTLLNDIAAKTKLLQRKTNADGTTVHKNGYYLGDYYYTGEAKNIIDLKGGTSESVLEGQGALSNWNEKLAGVTVRINKIEELVNKDFQFDENINYSSYGPYNNFTADSTKVTPAHGTYYFEYKEGDVEKTPIEKLDTYTIIQSRNGDKSLQPSEKDYSRKIILTKTLNTSNIKDMLFDSYNAEILSYSVASGRKSTSSTPGNLEYSYSANSEDTLTKMKNESDEFWGETIIITAPTGSNITLWIILGATCALIIAGGFFGIKKFVLKH